MLTPTKQDIKPEAANYSISHFNHPPLGPHVAIIFRGSRDQCQPGSLPQPPRRYKDPGLRGWPLIGQNYVSPYNSTTFARSGWSKDWSKDTSKDRCCDKAENYGKCWRLTEILFSNFNFFKNASHNFFTYLSYTCTSMIKQLHHDCQDIPWRINS